MRKYHPLSDYLIKQHEVTVSLTFHDIEQIIGFALPPSASNHRAWWANNLSHPQAMAWLSVGWKLNRVDMEKKEAVLIRPLILSIGKASTGGEALSLAVTMDNEDLALILSGPDGSATAGYSWRQIVQLLIDVNPYMFGNFKSQPDHRVFPEMLIKLGYCVVNWKTGESLKVDLAP